MPDAVGTRAKWAVMIPSTNTVVEHDFWTIRPRGITFHVGRMFISQPNIRNDADFAELVVQIRAALEGPIRDIMTCEPDYLVMGISVESFWGGLERAREYIKSLEDLTGLKVATGADACRRAAEVPGAKKIALVTRYQSVGDDQVVNYFKQIGIETVRVRGLKASSATGSAEIDEQASAPGPLRRPLLEKRADPLLRVVRQRVRRHHRAGEVVGAGLVPVDLRPEGLLADPDRQRARGDDLRDERVHRGVELGGGNDLVDKSPRLRGRRIDEVAGKEHLERPLATHRAR